MTRQNLRFATEKGFTLVEILVSAACLVLLMIPVFSIFTAGSRTSQRGLLRIDTSLESRRILRQISRDLKASVVVLNNQAGRRINLDSTIDGGLANANSRFPNLAYSFYCSAAKAPLSDGDPADIIDNRNSRTQPSPRNIAKITYTLEPIAGKGGFFRLIREEVYKQKKRKRVLSERVNYFFIKLVEFSPPGSGNQEFFQVSLQLADSLHQDDLKKINGKADLNQNQSNLIISDAFEIVYPESYNAFNTYPQQNPCWHTAEFKLPQ